MFSEKGKENSERARITTQRAKLGNQSMLSIKDTTCDISNVIQRKVGLEFQTLGGDWNINMLELKPNEVQAKIHSENDVDVYRKGAPRINLDAENHCTVSIDNHKDLEYITDAFDERSQKSELGLAVSIAVARHKKYTSTEPMPGTHMVGKYRLISNGTDIFCINSEGEPTAHPQATIGIRNEKIEKFLSMLAKDQTYLNDQASAEKGSQKKDIGKRNILEYVSTMDVTHLSPQVRGWVKLVAENIHGASLRETIVNWSLLPKMHTLQAKHDELLQQRNHSLLELDTENQDAGDLGNLEELTNTVLVIAKDLSSGESAEQHFVYWENSLADIQINFHAITDEIHSFVLEKVQTDTDYPIYEETGDFYDLFTYLKQLNQIFESDDSFISLVAKTSALREDMRQLRKEMAALKVKCIHWIDENIGKTIPENKNHPELQNEQLILFWEGFMERIENIPCVASLSTNVSLILESLRKQKKGTWAAKFNLPVKQRTSLKDLFYLLNPAERQEALVLLKKLYNGNTPVTEQDGRTLSLGRWLSLLDPAAQAASIKDPLPVHDIDNSDPKTFAAFNVTRSTDIGYDENGPGDTIKQVDGAILELRDMKRKVPPDEWISVAHCVANSVELINQVTEES